ncbi:50S ribosomal protein L6 [Syntrophobacter fumaroxidans]|uniref:Large ribosomal subunit protein uL6 n=1 Tax=Syntrophobacter fumaroxidans (strain DSM 10017 / MPOB) TaxID=335543 RepID=RL6_SYNFM|nr:50S ribosomal protein L6 [Syntrophobacter fumaroxidans]A0LIK5.1 RecName: Full=Large ribosomal subunit protein uL6; AltName: Full=50S ribosomal protein L6 [Syntrophobacter fumaroxidans MPOB]ABK17257.1 LSU ribosomal protein L6P [Syntrophobacter fumaroxidans MPOB]
MSRVGKLPITIPKGVDVSLDEPLLTIKGPKGTLARRMPGDVEVHLEQGAVLIRRKDESNKSRSLHGLVRALVNNMVHGVSEGFVISLEIQGTGYRADAQNNVLNLSLGYSHPIQFVLPEGIKGAVDRNTIRLEGIDKELLGQTAARIRALRPAEPYKGKGIRYAGEHIHRKVGKTGSKK